MREVSALPRHTPTEPKKDISTLLKRGLIILVTTTDVGRDILFSVATIE